MTGFWPLNRMPEPFVEIIIERAHTRRAWYGCVDCWAKIKPGPPARLIVDSDARTATTTGGV